MKNPVPIQLSVPQPCRQRWEEMTPGTNGRFCAHCQHPVIDFSTWTDPQLHRYFTQTTAAPVCGRFLTSQLHRPIQLPPQPASRLYRYFIGLGLTLIFSQLPAVAHAQYTPVHLAQMHRPDSTTQAPRPAGDTSAMLLNGNVLDAQQQPALYAIVMLTRNGEKVGEAVMTDLDGHFTLTLPDGQPVAALTLSVQYIGHNLLPLPLSTVDPTVAVNCRLTLTSELTTGLIIRTVWEPAPPGSTILQGDQLKNFAR